LETIKVSGQELKQLAANRAQQVQQKILESGKIESSRVSLANPDTSSTNQTSRVYFHLQ
jgi:hypothetical protein